MRYEVNINGIDVDASFSEESIHSIIEPLLLHLAKLRSEKGKRVLALLAAPPGAGKSTLASFLEYYSKEIYNKYDIYKEIKLQAIGMDGFHRRQEYLISHETEVDGRLLPMVRIKGAPITFDLPGLMVRVKRVSDGESCGWPTYDRHLHNPVEDAITISGDIVVLEGNYLLLDLDDWKDLRKMADYTIFLGASEDILRKRLVDRKQASGNSREDAEAFVDFSDMKNVRLCLEHSQKADLELQLNSQGEIEVKR